MKQLDLTVLTSGGGMRSVRVDVGRVLLAGYTGRDRARVMAHVRELEAHGVAPPARIPAVYVVAPELLTTESAVTVNGSQTSGEAEVYLVPLPDGLLVGVGSDHTDRAHEAIDVNESKALCPKPVSRSVWRYEDVRDHWDRLELRSWMTESDTRRLYQEGRLEALLGVDALLAELKAAGHGDLVGHAVFGGTLPALGGLAFGRRFEVELFDPVLDRRLGCAYDIA